jgi:mono/diheme cytochrome c family protein
MRIARLIVVAMALALAGLALAGGQAHSQERGDWRKGRSLARGVCAECHAVRARDLRSANANAPRFATIASTPGMTAMALNAALHTSHRTMPNVVLDADDTNNVIAYILSLKN